MKILAKDLKHGQRFRMEGGVAIASGLVDASGSAVSLVSGRVCYVPDWHQVELIDPPEATADCIVVGAGGSNAKAPTYTELQAEWCNDYGIKVGSKVKVTRAFTNVETDGLPLWIAGMGKYVGMVGAVRSIATGCVLIAIDGATCWWPYFVLELVKASTYRPYTDAELLEQLGAKVRLKDSVGLVGYLVAVVDSGIAIINNRVIESHVLLAEYEHLDGAPCGVKE